MTRPITHIVNVTTGEEIVREMNDEEYTIWLNDKEKIDAERSARLELQAEEKLSAKLVDLIVNATGGFSKYEIDNAAALGLTFATSTFGKAKEVKTFGAVETANATNFNDALSEIQESAFQARFCSSPIVVGGKSMQQYMQRLESGCCASNGFDIVISKHFFNIVKIISVIPIQFNSVVYIIF
jgi:hypothetical protein